MVKDISNNLDVTVIWHNSKKKFGRFSLRKEKLISINKISMPPEIVPKYSSVELDSFIMHQLGDNICCFANVILDNFSKEDLSIFYNNFNDLKVDYFPYEDKKRFGVYIVCDNKILVSREDIWGAIFHELFHMATAFVKDGVVYIGFSQEKDFSYGNGINEGYTQLLTERYFGNLFSIKETYPFEKNVVKNLETLIGKKKMESLYLRADLHGLIDELQKFAPRDDIGRFISQMDSLCGMFSGELSVNRDKILTELICVYDFLLRICVFKLMSQLNNGNITMDEFRSELVKYIYSLGDTFIFDGVSYVYAEIDDIYDELVVMLPEEECYKIMDLLLEFKQKMRQKNRS